MNGNEPGCYGTQVIIGSLYNKGGFQMSRKTITEYLYLRKLNFKNATLQ